MKQAALQTEDRLNLGEMCFPSCTLKGTGGKRVLTVEVA